MDDEDNFKDVWPARRNLILAGGLLCLIVLAVAAVVVLAAIGLASLQ